MAVYESPRYKDLGFYVNDAFCKFNGGFYHTENANEIAVLDAITDCVRVAEEKPEEVTQKAPSQRKSSAK